jgi:hypothetical protein
VSWGEMPASILILQNKRVSEILDEHTVSPASSEFLKKWSSQEDWDLDLAQEILFEFKKGITE